MEQKKMLWIIFAITLFVSVVVAGGYIWFLPSDKHIVSDTMAVSDKNKNADFDPIEWVRKTEEVPVIKKEADTEKTKDFVIVYGEIDGEEPQIEEDTTEKMSTDTVSPTQRTAAPASRVVLKAPSAQSESSEPVKQVPKKVKVTEYWIQAGSYESNQRAEQTRDFLEGKGLNCTINSKIINNTDYFRVRIGPYSKNEEANKFLDWIKEVKGFENSYISEVYVIK